MCKYTLSMSAWWIMSAPTGVHSHTHTGDEFVLVISLGHFHHIKLNLTLLLNW